MALLGATGRASLRRWCWLRLRWALVIGSRTIPWHRARLHRNRRVNTTVRFAHGSSNSSDWRSPASFQKQRDSGHFAPLATGPIALGSRPACWNSRSMRNPSVRVDSCVAVTCGECGIRGPVRLRTKGSTAQFRQGECDLAESGSELESVAESKRRPIAVAPVQSRSSHRSYPSLNEGRGRSPSNRSAWVS